MWTTIILSQKIAHFLNSYLDYTFEPVATTFAIFLIFFMSSNKVDPESRLHKGLEWTLGVSSATIVAWGVGFCISFTLLAFSWGLIFLEGSIRILIENPIFVAGGLAGAAVMWLIKHVRN